MILLNRLLRYGLPKLACVSVSSVVQGPELITLNFSLRLILSVFFSILTKIIYYDDDGSHKTTVNCLGFLEY